eukprot:CAMPEP_0172906222 /NCGR_PEP_ID=MMETSP1075-20121228/176380_1 /TAXON_ID=2916 /ORGANISM="Ceratium fusus, Strain PA161109" /LENGTH=146 /DNA_ID=CAMNT_0013763609 /DNA_START=268 /DNA_END=710 /DNA_ORIENTATION=+
MLHKINADCESPTDIEYINGDQPLALSPVSTAAPRANKVESATGHDNCTASCTGVLPWASVELSAATRSPPFAAASLNAAAITMFDRDTCKSQQLRPRSVVAADAEPLPAPASAHSPHAAPQAVAAAIAVQTEQALGLRAQAVRDL